MIYAELQPSENCLVMRYSNANGEFKNNPFFPVISEQEARRMLHFKNRKYVVETLTKWLNQRNHALKSTNPTSIKLLQLLQHIEKAGFIYICGSIGKFRNEFESLRPPANSRFYNYYQNTIVPILDFCTVKPL